jgi:hypothetical protein
MFPFNNGKGTRMDAKCYATLGTYTGYIDAKSPPTRKKPFSCVLRQAFTSSVGCLASYLPFTLFVSYRVPKEKGD